MAILRSTRVTLAGTSAQIIFDPQGMGSTVTLRVISGGPIDIGGNNVSSGQGFQVSSTDVPFTMILDPSEILYGAGTGVVSLLYVIN